MFGLFYMSCDIYNTFFFRNETVDATHLCEFHQIEGVIADYGLTLGGLMEFVEIFFSKMGVTE